MASLRKLGGVLLGGAALCGCDAEAGEDYQGEVLLSLGGTVVSGPEVNPDETLVLLFRHGEKVVAVDGVTTGEFPSQFRFEVTTPPPEEAYFNFESFDDPPDYRYTSALLAVMPKDHPAVFDEVFGDPSELEPPGEEAYSVDWRRCTPGVTSEARDCVVEELGCTPHDCETFLLSGDPALLESEPGIQFPTGAMVEGSSCSLHHACAETDPLDCARAVVCCDIPAEPRGTLHISMPAWRQWTSCDVKAVRGNRELAAALDAWRIVARNVRVFYAEADLTLFPDTPQNLFLHEGYNVVTTATDAARRLEHDLCALDVTEQVYAEYNEAHGTSYNPYTSAESQEEYEQISMLLSELGDVCGDLGASSQVVAQGEAHLEIELGSPPSAD